MHRLLALTSLLALAACAAGPDYVAPVTAGAAAAPFIGGGSVAVSATQEPDGDWWRLYRDPVLDGLIADAFAANKDIAVATANIARARAALRGVRSDRLPQTTIDASGDYRRFSSFQTVPQIDRETSVVDAQRSRPKPPAPMPISVRSRCASRSPNAPWRWSTRASA